MAKKSKVISIAAARRRERKISGELAQACAIIATRDETIKLREEQIGELIKKKGELRRLFFDTAHDILGFTADLKVIADVLRAHGAEDAEARLRSIAVGCEDRQRHILHVLEPVQAMAATGRDQERR
jgi:hypothetical protein